MGVGLGPGSRFLRFSNFKPNLFTFFGLTRDRALLFPIKQLVTIHKMKFIKINHWHNAIVHDKIFFFCYCDNEFATSDEILTMARLPSSGPQRNTVNKIYSTEIQIAISTLCFYYFSLNVILRFHFISFIYRSTLKHGNLGVGRWNGGYD